MSFPLMVTAGFSQLQHLPEWVMTQSCSQAGEPLVLWLMCLRKNGSCQRQESYEEICEEMYLENGRRNRRNVWKGITQMHSWKKVTHARAGASLRVWICDTPQGLQSMEAAQSKGKQLSKKQQMENLTHTTPTSYTSHHLTKGFGRDECIAQQNQGKWRLGSGEKRYSTETGCLLLAKVRLPPALLGRKKRFPSLSTTFIFIYSQCLWPLISFLQKQKLNCILTKDTDTL